MASGREKPTAWGAYHPSRRMAVVFGVLASILWGASFVGVKVALRDFSPIALLVFRYGIALIIMAPIVHWLEGIRLPNRRQLPALLLLGALGVSLNQLLQSFGMLWTSASQASWLTAVAPVMIAVMGWIFLREGHAKRQILGLALSMAGAVLISYEPNPNPAQAASRWGPVLILLAALAWAGFTVLGKRLVISLLPLNMTTIALFLGWFLILPAFIGTGAWQGLDQVSMRGWLAVIFLAVACTVGAYTLYFLALRGAETALVAVVQYLEPMTTMVLAAFILQERLTWMSLLGGALILMGVVLVERANVRTLKIPVA